VFTSPKVYTFDSTSTKTQVATAVNVSITVLSENRNDLRGQACEALNIAEDATALRRVEGTRSTSSACVSLWELRRSVVNARRLITFKISYFYRAANKIQSFDRKRFYVP
jgi:hypothetical protein